MLAAAMIGVGLVLPAVPAQASVVTPLEKVFSETLFGKAISVGNGSMRCPTAADGVNLRPSTSFVACAEAQAGTVPAGTFTNNNEYSMRQNDTDGRSDTFNNSSATLSIPEGATVRYAALEWGGHTGEFKTASGTTSAIRSCNIIGQQYVAQFPTALPPAPAAATPEEQAPGIQVDGHDRTVVTPHVTRDSGDAWPNNSDRMYTGWADVTSQFQELSFGATTTVTVSNIWAPSGVNCAAGWALTVVWAFDEPVPGVVDYQSSINIFRGHIRQGSADLPSSVTFSGFEAATSTNRIGIVAYEGDRGTVGDRFSINGTDIPEPTGYGSINDFFVSSAVGTASPMWPVNFSVDVNEFATSLIHAGDTEATLGFRTNGDGYWLQSLWLETPVASLLISKSSDITVGRPGDPVVWTITVSNPSPAEVTDVVVRDPVEESCSRLIPSELLSADSFTYTCSGTLPDHSVTNTAFVTGRTLLGSELSAESSASVEVIHPALTITKSADARLYLDGDTVRFTIRVKNAGDVVLNDVDVTDVKTPTCSASIGALAPNEERIITCAAIAPIAGDENTVTVTGTDPLGNTVSDSGTALATLARPGLQMRKSVSADRVLVGQAVTYTLAVTNTGNVRLDEVSISDERLSACSAEVGSLLPGETRSTTCTWSSPGPQTFVNVAVASATPMRCLGDDQECEEVLTDVPLVASDSAEVTVLAPTSSPTDEGTGSPTGGAGGSPTSGPGGGRLPGTGAGPGLYFALALLTLGGGLAVAARHRRRPGRPL